MMQYSYEVQSAIDLLKNLIEIPSLSREEEKLVDFLEMHLEALGFMVSRHKNNIWLLSPSFDVEKPTILLNSHIDTVKPSAAWKRNPYAATVEDNVLYGLGSNDAGASVVSLLAAFQILTQKNQAYNLIFAASAEEEVSGVNGIENLLNELPRIDFAIVGEPTNMQMAVAEKGLMVLDCTVTGKSGHAARNEGENAIYKAFNDLEWFRNYQFEEVSELLGPVKMTVTQIAAGTQHNVVPDLCSFVVDIRSNEKYSNAQILDIVSSHVDCELKARSTRLSSTATPLDHPIVKKAQSMGMQLYGSPTLSDQALMKFSSVKIGPGDSARSHTADEYILLDEINDAVIKYVQLLDGLKWA